MLRTSLASLLLLSVWTCGCGGPEQAASETPAAAVPSPATLPPATGVTVGMSKTDKEPAYHLDQIGSSLDLAKEPVMVSALEPLTVGGWAVDPDLKKSVEAVDVVIDQTPYAAQSGMERADVANHFKNPGYLNSGFVFSRPAAEFPRGPHSVTVRIVRQGQKTYFETPAVSFVIQ